MAADLAGWGVDTIVGPMDHQATMLRFLTDLPGRPPNLVEGVYLWRDPVIHASAPART